MRKLSLIAVALLISSLAAHAQTPGTSGLGVTSAATLAACQPLSSMSATLCAVGDGTLAATTGINTTPFKVIPLGSSQGPAGPAGPAGTIAVGTVTTGAPGTPATVANVGTTSAAILNFTIPQGQPGTAATFPATLTCNFTLQSGGIAVLAGCH